MISSWGVGTHLATAYDYPALDGVYKLSALRNTKGEWEYKLKLSEDSIKTSNPGRHQVRRFFCNEKYVMDVIYDLALGISDTADAMLLDDPKHIKKLDDIDAFVDLLIPVFREGHLVLEKKSIHEIRKKAVEEAENFYKIHGENPYPVGLEKKLHDLKEKLTRELRKK